MRKTLYNSKREPNCHDIIIEFDRRLVSRMIPSDESWIVYEAGKNQGTGNHNNIFSIFGTVIIVVDETLNFPLQVLDLHVPFPTDLSSNHELNRRLRHPGEALHIGQATRKNVANENIITIATSRRIIINNKITITVITL